MMDIWLEWIYSCTIYSSVNNYQNQVKMFTLKVQDDVELAIAKCCFSIKDCWSQASFNDFIFRAI